MPSWPDCRDLDLLHIEVPIIQAPMAVTTAMAVAGLGGGLDGGVPDAQLAATLLYVSHNGRLP